MDRLPQTIKPIYGKLINLRELDIEDVKESYVNWLNDKEINVFLESRHSSHTKESTSIFVQNCRTSNKDILFGIFTNENNKHIGNIKLGDIDWQNKNANVGILIGSKEYWGKGIGSQAIELITRLGFESLKLSSLCAGCYEENIGSKKAFLKAGWFVRGILPNWRINHLGFLTNEIFLSITKDEILFFENSIQKITLIGAGEILISTAKYLISKGKELLVILAPRHASNDFINLLKELKIEIIISEEVNNEEKVMEFLKKYSDLCLCFGPAWIFNQEIIKIFRNKIFNYNGIPLPNYLGGAHYTWQILNKDFEGGAYIQQITENIDRGPIVASFKYQIKQENKKPIGFEKINIEEGFKLIKKFFEKNLFEDNFLKTNNHQISWDQLSYFPRLNTKKNGWINWNWEGSDIESFCNAFDDPYPGARTLIEDKVLILKKVSFIENKNIHPFCAGIITRINRKNDELFIAVKGGTLRVERILDEDGSLVKNNLKLGKRLYTKISLLESSLEEVKYDSIGPEKK